MQNSLEEFMQLAEMSNKKFEAQRGGDVIIDMNTVIPNGEGKESMDNYVGLMSKFLSEENIRNPQYKPLKIPRRPAWNKD